MPDLTLLPLARITHDDGIQSRAELCSETVAEYAEALSASPPAVRPIADPVIVYFDGATHWLAAGFHWAHAHLDIGRRHMECLVRRGSRRDAILCSVAANHKHGKRRTNADKRRALCMLLDDEEWGAWPNTQLAARAGVCEAFVRKVKAERRFALCDPPESSDPAGQADPDEVAHARGQATRSARKLWRHLWHLSTLTGQTWRDLLGDYIAAAEAFEVAKGERRGKSA